MTQAEIDKIEEILLAHYSIHESDYLINLITDPDKTAEDIKDFMKYCDKCSSNDIDSDIETYEKNRRSEL